jgi:hypothetical protein
MENSIDNTKKVIDFIQSYTNLDQIDSCEDMQSCIEKINTICAHIQINDYNLDINFENLFD